MYYCQDVTQSEIAELYLYSIPVKILLTDTLLHDRSEHEKVIINTLV